MTYLNFEELKKIKDRLIEFVRSLNIDLILTSKSKRCLGCYIQKTNSYKTNIIKISANLLDKKFIEVLSHEFAHFVHNIMINTTKNNNDNLSFLFNIDMENFDLINIVNKELINVTYYIDKNSTFENLNKEKDKVKNKIKILEFSIKEKYPYFLKSRPFYEFNKYIKKSEARFLLKYDNVRLITPFLKCEKKLSINNIDNDFKDMPIEFRNYLRLKSLTKKQTNITKKINNLKKYYYNPNELFARFIEGIIIDNNLIKNIANTTYNQFYYLLKNGYYPYLNEYLSLLKLNIKQY